MSAKTRELISKVAREINGKNLFEDKIEMAKMTLQHVKSFPS